MLHKSATGRVLLYHEDEHTLFREVNQSASTLHNSSRFYLHKTNQVINQPATGICCWHCCHAFDDSEFVYKLPQSYDIVRKMFLVYGAFCSLECALSYMLSDTSNNIQNRTCTFHQLCREIYGRKDTVTPAPPRETLAMFGGPYSIDEFRSKSRSKSTSVKIQSPPFVSYAMLVEESGPNVNSNHVATEKNSSRERIEVTGIQRPEKAIDTYHADLSAPRGPCLYDSFVEKQNKHSAAADDEQESEASPQKKGRVTKTRTRAPAESEPDSAKQPPPAAAAPERKTRAARKGGLMKFMQED